MNSELCLISGMTNEIKFKCKSAESAALHLYHSTCETKAFVGLEVLKFMKRNWRNWTESAAQIHYNAEGSIIFVSGFAKTGSKWALTAITKNEISGSLSFDVGTGSFVGLEAGGARHVVMPIAQRKWPGPMTNDQSLTFDHCVFIRYWKARFRVWPLPMFMEAAAGPDTLPPPDQAEDGNNPALSATYPDDDEFEEMPSSCKVHI